MEKGLETTSSFGTNTYEHACVYFCHSVCIFCARLMQICMSTFAVIGGEQQLSKSP